LIRTSSVKKREREREREDKEEKQKFEVQDVNNIVLDL
jgi:hypothetical protein